MGVDFTQVLSGHIPGTHQQTFLGETHPMQRHSAGFCKSAKTVLGEGTKEMWSLARHARLTGIPAKHRLAELSTLIPQTNPGLSLPRLVAAEGGTHRECCWLWAPWGGSGCRRGVPPRPWRTACRPQPLLPTHLPTCLPRVAGRMVAVGQEGLISYDGGLGAGGPVQVGWRDCLGGAGPGLPRGAPSQP